MPKEKTLRELVKVERARIVELLQAGGHAEMIDENTAEPLDWIRTIMESNADIALECHYDLNDPQTNDAVRRKLARLVAIAEAWDSKLN